MAGLPALLAVAFIVLKLLGYIAWPWVWVLAPIWGGIALGLLVVFFAVFMAAITGQLGGRHGRIR